MRSKLATDSLLVNPDQGVQLPALLEILNCLEQVVLITDGFEDPPHPKILWVNDAFERMTGYKRAEALGNSPRMLQCAATDKSELARIRQTIVKPDLWRTARFNLVNCSKAGREFRVELTLSPIWLKPDYAPTDRPDAWFAVQREIPTDESSIVELYARQSQNERHEALGIMAAGIAHDFNNILTSILSTAELGLSGSTAFLRQSAQDVIAAARQGAEMIKNLVRYTREDGQPSEAGVPLSLADVIDGLAPLLRNMLPRSIRLAFTKADGCDVPYRLQPASVGQVLMNFVQNAGEALGEHPGSDMRVTVEAGTRHYSEAAVARLHGASFDPGDHGYISVSDNGRGISSERMLQLFTPYASSKGRGRGIGLYSCLRLAQSMGCAIDVQSTHGEGSTFSLVYPPSLALVPSTAEPTEMEELDTGEYGAISDDDPMVRKTTLRVLEFIGIKAKQYTHAGEVLHALRSGRTFRFVLADLNGYDSADHRSVRLIRREFPDVKVVMVSGVGEWELRKVASELGTPFFLNKPFTVPDMRGVMASLGIASS